MHAKAVLLKNKVKLSFFFIKKVYIFTVYFVEYRIFSSKEDSNAKTKLPTSTTQLQLYGWHQSLLSIESQFFQKYKFFAMKE